MAKPVSESKQVAFGSFDPTAEVDVRQRSLPHWFQAGAAMFVTFRTADSMPREVIRRWRRELEAWLTARSLPVSLAESTAEGKLTNHDALLSRLGSTERREFKKLSDRIFNRRLDECHGACQLRRPEIAKIVSDAILFYQETKYVLDCFIVMPNHVHAIVQFRDGGKLGTVSQCRMRYTAREINAATGGSGAFWQPEPFDHIIRGPEQFEYLQQYVADNPREANLSAGEFLYWERS